MSEPTTTTTTDATSIETFRVRRCPVCRAAMLDAPGHCPTCGTIRLFKVQQPRLIHATYEREVWALDAEQATRIAEEGTAWPQSYDERRESVECGDWSAEDVTGTGILRDEGGYDDDAEWAPCLPPEDAAPVVNVPTPLAIGGRLSTRALHIASPAMCAAMGPLSATTVTEWTDPHDDTQLLQTYSPRYEQGNIVLSAEEFERVEALCEDQSGPTPAMLELLANNPPANPITFGDVWIGNTRPNPEGFARFAAGDIDGQQEIDRLRAENAELRKFADGLADYVPRVNKQNAKLSEDLASARSEVQQLAALVERLQLATEERERLRKMRDALVALANCHAPECCGYCAHVRRQLDAVLDLGPPIMVEGPLPPVCEKWPQ